MQRKDNKFLIAIVVLVLLGISIGYAVIGGDFSLEGSLTVKGNTWDIRTGTINDYETTGKSTGTLPKASAIEDNVIDITYTVILDKPGDSYSFVVPIENHGTISAILDDIENVVPTGSEKSLDYKVELVDYEDDGKIIASTLEKGIKLPAKDKSISTINVRITVTYKDDNNESIALEDISGQVTTKLRFIQDKNY